MKLLLQSLISKKILEKVEEGSSPDFDYVKTFLFFFIMYIYIYIYMLVIIKISKWNDRKPVQIFE
jgi:hypothetical protein